MIFADLALDNLADAVLDHSRLALFDVEASLGDEDAVLELLVAFAAGLWFCGGLLDLVHSLSGLECGISHLEGNVRDWNTSISLCCHCL